MKAMNGAFKYANRYGYPGRRHRPGNRQAPRREARNIMLGAGSGEILDVVGTTFLQNGKKVVGVEPSYS